MLVIIGAAVALGLAVHQSMPPWYARLWYPLEHDAAINRDAQRYGLDPALVAAVAWRESGFDASAMSPRGAVGVMQILPSTATFIATQNAPPPGMPDDIEDPAVNIAYGAWYLRYLIDMHDGSVGAALASYNAGPGAVQSWQRAAQARGSDLRIPDDIPLDETRGYVTDVLAAWPIYRSAHGDRLGAVTVAP